ncbi:MAG: hypothetical protein RL385_4405, partial [Pseudomonadota bacterium]
TEVNLHALRPSVGAQPAELVVNGV